MKTVALAAGFQILFVATHGSMLGIHMIQRAMPIRYANLL
jgi:hypothetical protein